MTDIDPNHAFRPLQCWSPARLDLLDWLSRNAPSLAELYQGAVQISYDSRIPGWTRLVCHAIREIGTRVPEVFTGEKAGMLQHTNRVQDIRVMWESMGLPTDGSFPIGQLASQEGMIGVEGVELPRGVYLKVAELIRDHVGSWQSRKALAVKFFSKVAGQDADAQKTLRPLVEQWSEIVQWFVSRAHDKGQPDSEYDSEELESKFELFEATLRAVVRGFFSTTDEIDEILDQANS